MHQKQIIDSLRREKQRLLSRQKALVEKAESLSNDTTKVVLSRKLNKFVALSNANQIPGAHKNMNTEELDDSLNRLQEELDVRRKIREHIAVILQPKMDKLNMEYSEIDTALQDLKI